MNKCMQLHSIDHVAVALHPLQAGEELYINGKKLVVKEDIKQGHKISLIDINENSPVIKYGYPIGHATKPIKQGEWIHTHNLKTNLDAEEAYTFNQELRTNTYERKNLTFQGYRRKNGKVGIRNDLLIVPTVGCVNGVAEQTINLFKERNPDLTGIDNISVLKHPYGCSQLGDDHMNTLTILKNITNHPNAAGVLVFGLGCENNTIQEFKKAIGQFDDERIKFIIAQEHEDEIEAGVNLLEDIFSVAKFDTREEIPLSELKIGLKCGGSDGFSGITANPLLGAFSDFLISQGGTTILTEVPEMFGAERILMSRAKDEAVFHKIVALINDFKAYFLTNGETVNENPSPGNKDGGISTLEDKSLGCIQKAGSSTVIDVLKYGETLKEKGLNLLQAPGNDLVATTALAAAESHMVLFTTGRGTPFGGFVPTIKVASNTDLFTRKNNWMDFDAGQLLTKPMDAVLDEFISYLIGVANGNFTKNEQNNIRELAIFKTGVTL
ncbi:UxaA family hydrolase [Gottfriedia solisilvae]|uniref:Altronate hydrolase n=1 Tax=Gottfriedia solisilvae TaxID=1516104 RepID=A0A8J3AIU4_9BACI|nr:altronate dehydratase family protein [Gottfriedia solisilvae]GGI10896.1 altronate hydrolase [Gottfriedia solisilvae]